MIPLAKSTDSERHEKDKQEARQDDVLNLLSVVASVVFFNLDALASVVELFVDVAAGVVAGAVLVAEVCYFLSMSQTESTDT